MGKRGPAAVSRIALRGFSRLYFRDLRALARGRKIRKFSGQRYEKHIHEHLSPRPSYGQRLEIEEQVAKSVSAGEISIENAPGVIGDLVVIKQFLKNRNAHDAAEKMAWVKHDELKCTSAIQAILNGSADEIRQACVGAFKIVEKEVRKGEFQPVEIPVWPIDDGSQFPYYLAIHAEQIVTARIDPHYPGSNRPSSQEKQLRFLARALAGAVQGRSTRTAINILNRRKKKRK